MEMLRYGMLLRNFGFGKEGVSVVRGPCFRTDNVVVSLKLCADVTYPRPIHIPEIFESYRVYLGDGSDEGEEDEDEDENKNEDEEMAEIG